MSKSKKIKDAVKKRYSLIAKAKSKCCCSTAPLETCTPKVTDISHSYNKEELETLPEGANLGLGCGNPLALTEIKSGETVLDLGSGAGIDVFLAAKKVGPKGKIIGLDMTDEMLIKARENAKKAGIKNVEFKKGEIEDMPIPSNSIDLVISNCVINLVPDKKKAYQEIYRVLKPKGRFSVSDMVTRGNIPEEIKEDMEAWAGCVAGALDKDDYLSIVKECGFKDVQIKSEVEYDYKRTDKFGLVSMGLVGFKK
ncbi:MAG: arsenite methyltransferase [candidate division Zixibacteria bacterium]|nr:arsenite methyltransferase [candidate division Zixibacteria bacterium]